MSDLIIGLIAVGSLLGFVWFLVKISKSYAEEQKGKKEKKITKEQHKGGLK